MTKVKRSFCGFENNVETFRQARSPWRFRFYMVRMLECPKCRGVSNYYEGASSRGKHSVFVIKVRLRI